MQICVNAYTRNALSAIFAKRKQQRYALNSLSTHTGGTKTICEKHFLLSAHKHLLHLLVGSKLITHIFRPGCARRREKETRASGREWKKAPYIFSAFNCFATRCSLKCGAHYIAAQRRPRGDNIDAFSSPQNRYCAQNTKRCRSPST